ncbi:MAG: rhomboid family intramembrane serine protease [Bacteroidota bacterium]
MDFSITSLLCIITAVISFSAPVSSGLFGKLCWHPYSVKHNKEWYRSITHAFVHVDIFHLIFNLIALYSFGRVLEEAWMLRFDTAGKFYFIIFYISAAVFSTLISFKRNQDNVYYRAAGASGAVSGVLFASILVIPEIKVAFIFFPVGIPGWIFAAMYLAAEYYFDKQKNKFIAHDAHISGAVYGIIFTLILDYHYGINFWNTITSYF